MHLDKIETAILRLARDGSVADTGGSERAPIQRLVASGFLEPHPSSPVGREFYRITPAGIAALNAESGSEQENPLCQKFHSLDSSGKPLT